MSISQVTIEFIDNSSQLGTVALLNTFSFCSWTGHSGSFFEPEKVLLDWSGVTLMYVCTSRPVPCCVPAVYAQYGHILSLVVVCILQYCVSARSECTSR